MNEKHVIQYMQERLAGVSSYAHPLPETPVYLAPDRPYPGRFVRQDGSLFEGGVPTGQDREEVVWVGAGPSTASRQIARRTKRSFRIRDVDAEDQRAVVAESMIEYGFWLIQRAEDRRRRIHDQPPARSYVLPDGRSATHTFDFLVEEPDGLRLAFAVRPSVDVDEKLTTAVECIRRQSLTGFADEALIVTERFVTKARTRNAVEILEARAARNDADVAAAAVLVSRLRGAVMLGALVEAMGLGPRGRVALICLIDDGLLELVHRERLGATTLLRPASRPSTAH